MAHCYCNEFVVSEEQMYALHAGWKWADCDFLPIGICHRMSHLVSGNSGFAHPLTSLTSMRTRGRLASPHHPVLSTRMDLLQPSLRWQTSFLSCFLSSLLLAVKSFSCLEYRQVINTSAQLSWLPRAEGLPPASSKLTLCSRHGRGHRHAYTLGPWPRSGRCFLICIQREPALQGSANQTSWKSPLTLIRMAVICSCRDQLHCQLWGLRILETFLFKFI